MNRPLVAILAILAGAPAPPADAQQAPRRPRLGAQADTNDATAWFRYGLDRLERDPRGAAGAFYWAERLDPASAQILYARHVALLLAEGQRLVPYLRGDAGALEARGVREADSLLRRAFLQEPFLHRGLDEWLLLVFMRRAIGRDASSSSLDDISTGDLARAMDTVFAEYNPLLRGVLAASRSRYQEALLYYRRALATGRQEDVVQWERANAYMQLRRPDSARQALAEAIALRRRDAERTTRRAYENLAQWEFALGRIQEEQRDTAAARASYQRALTEDLALYPAHVRLGLLALRAGDTTAAVTELHRAAAVNENDYLSRATLGGILGQLGRREDALAHLRAATRIEPWAAAAWLLLARALDEAGQRAAAVDAYLAWRARARRGDPTLAAVERRLDALRSTSTP